MQTVRTTITLPVDLHEELRLKAVKEKKSLGDVVVEELEGKKSSAKKVNTKKEIERTIAFFKKIAKEGKQIDAVKAIREQREERTNKLASFLDK